MVFFFKIRDFEWLSNACIGGGTLSLRRSSSSHMRLCNRHSGQDRCMTRRMDHLHRRCIRSRWSYIRGRSIVSDTMAAAIGSSWCCNHMDQARHMYVGNEERRMGQCV